MGRLADGHHPVRYCLGAPRAPASRYVGLETALSMLPGLLAAHRWLAALYGQPGGNLAKATQHRKIFAELRRKRERVQ